MNTLPSWEFLPVKDVELPVFRHNGASRSSSDYVVFYAPGFLTVVEAAQARRLEAALRAQIATGTAIERVAADLVAHARQALQRREAMLTSPFRPVCLTLYVGDRCNLDCVYCYAAPPATARTSLSAVDVLPAADLVAENCARAGRPMVVVVHGGGEPGLHREVVDEALGAASRSAAHAQIKTFRYVATNGVLPVDTVRWLIRRFDVVGLSCDGPDDIQAAQRPTRAGHGTTRTVERTADAIRSAGRGLHVRVTVTPSTLNRLTEIVGYLCDRLMPDEIHLEPVYRGGRTGPHDGFAPTDATAFVTGLLAARATAASSGVPLRTSASRPSEIHGPFCHVFRSVLQLTPGGAVSACFKDTGTTAWARIGQSTGHGGVALDDRRVAELRAQLGSFPARCRNCFNRFHCTLGCPDRCPANSEQADRFSTTPASFCCRLSRELTGRALLDAAEDVWLHGRPSTGSARPVG